MGRYTEFLQRAAATPAYWAHHAMRSFVDDLLSRMDARLMSRAQLAQALGVKPSYVSKILRGDANFTLESMTKLAMATGGKLRVQIVDDAESISIAPTTSVERSTIYFESASRRVARSETHLRLVFSEGEWVANGEREDCAQLDAA